MRHSQPAILIVAYEGKALDFIPPFPDEVIDNRINLFYFIFSEANERCAKHKFRNGKSL